MLAAFYDLCVSSPKESAREALEAFGFKHYEINEAFTAINPWEPFNAQILEIAK